MMLTFQLLKNIEKVILCILSRFLVYLRWIS